MSLLKRTIPIPTFRRPDAKPPTVPVPAFRAPFARPELVAPEAPVLPPPAPPTPADPLPSHIAKKAVPKVRTGVKPLPDPRKGGRPRHNVGTTRDVKATISLSQDEADVMSAAAAREGLAFSAWVRRIIFDVARVVQRPHAERGGLEGSV